MSFVFRAAVAGVIGCLIYTLQLEELSTQRRSFAVLALLGYGWLLRRYRAAKRQRSGNASQTSDYLVAFATETGTARSIAKQTAKRLRKIGATATTVELGELAKATPPTKALLVVASTTGNGDPPKSASNWLSDDDLLLPYRDKHFAVLALGDRSYPRFCQFGYDVNAELQSCGSSALFEIQLVSDSDEASIEYWYQLLTSADETLGNKFTEDSGDLEAAAQ